ncbi:ATP-binding protein [Anabaenopsis sp. FSS-46]|uniref:sensor histidine kinase n=1 Tax=Anabaenopsis sp. FSS-46 TaxID=2971766 RepID=UPI002476222C|nr:PAS domain-containing sensor histidine kinase [Anabaenopsis sp. FSS-46]MDH6097482.1 ATP-binding protein [Anabaenopsis sp. FSS-46]
MDYSQDRLFFANFTRNIQTEIDLKFAYFLIDQAVEPAFCLGENYQLIFVNDAICKMTGYSREELLSMRLYHLDIDFDIHRLSKIKSEDYFTFKSRYRNKQQRIFTVETSIIYLKKTGQTFACAVVRPQRDEAIDLSIKPVNINILFTLPETIEANIFLIQGNRIFYVNSAVQKFTGYSKEELLNNFDFNGIIKSKKPINLCLQKELPDFEYQVVNILTPDGTERSLIGGVTKLDGIFQLPVKPEELIIAIDITDYKNLESSFNNALQQAKQISELRAQFLSMVCHQLRTPLNIISFCNSLVAEEIDKHTKQKIESLLENIEKAIAQISQMLDDTLLFAQAESGKINFDPKPLDLVKFCHNLVAEMHIISMEKRINFLSNLEVINAFFDAKLLDYILKNLLENAIKYSPKNSMIDLIMTYQEKYIFFQVKDQGIGIPTRDKERLFEAFYRGSNIGNIHGNGLGLSIIKTLVDLHGGQVNLESEVDKGTTITVMLPLVKEASFL